jgi:GlpG protein
MRESPKWTQFYRFPAIASTCILAIGFTVAWWCKIDVSAMFETAMIRRGELWRLFTSVLLHGSILHLVFNIYWFWVFGTSIEKVFGHAKTAALILL